MNLVLLIGFFLETCAILFPARAADAPSAPLMAKHAPDFAHWKVVYAYPDKRDEQIDPAALADPQVAQALQADPSCGLHLNPPRVRLQDFVKTRNVIHLQESYARDFTSERWIVDLAQIVKPMGEQTLIPILNTAFSDYLDLSQTDFPGLEWVSRATYNGETSVGDKKYFTFEQDTPAAFLEVNENTLLPVLLKAGDVTRTYQFETPPAAMLTLPGNYQQALDAANAGVRSLIHGLPPQRGADASHAP